MSLSIRRRKKWNKAVVIIKAKALAQTDNQYNQTNDITQTDQQPSQD
jgi:hypothetical protein